MTEQNVATIDRNKPPLVILGERLDARIGEIKAALPDDVRPEQMIRAVKTAAQLNPDLQACTWSSLWTACLRACQDGLLPDGRQGAIVPYKERATWVPMYQGVIERAYRSGQVKWIGAGVVREGDVFEHWTDTNGEHFRHVPGDDIGSPVVRAWAAATLKAGGFLIAVLPRAELDRIQALSKARREDSPWKTHPAEMQKKTAIKRLAKMLPFEVRITDEDDEGDEPEPERAPIAVTGNRPAGVAAALDAFAGSDEQQEQTTTADEKAPVSDSAPAHEPPSDAAPASPPADHQASQPAAAPQSAPKKFEEYVALVEATCAAARDADELKRWFASDGQRKLRNACGLIAEDTAQCKGVVETRIKQLSGQKQ